MEANFFEVLVELIELKELGLKQDEIQGYFELFYTYKDI
jgi:hypothetical protein